MRPFFDKLDHMEKLLPYLGGEKYPDLLKMAQKYHKVGDEVGEEAPGQIERKGGFDTEAIISKTMLQNKSKIDAGVKKIKRQEAIKTSLNHLDDEIVCDVFVKIINLIRFF